MSNDVDGWQAFNVYAWWRVLARQDLQRSHLLGIQACLHILSREEATAYPMLCRRSVVGLGDSLSSTAACDRV